MNANQTKYNEIKKQLNEGLINHTITRSEWETLTAEMLRLEKIGIAENWIKPTFYSED